MLELTAANLRQVRELSPTSSLSSFASAESSSSRELEIVNDDLLILVTRLTHRGDHKFLRDVDIRVKDNKLVRNNGKYFGDDPQECRQLLDRLNTRYHDGLQSGAATAIFGSVNNLSVDDDARHVARRKLKRFLRADASESANQAKPLEQAVRRTKRGFDDKAHDTFDSGTNESQSSTRLYSEPESAARKRQRRGSYGRAISSAGKLDEFAPPKRTKLNSDHLAQADQNLSSSTDAVLAVSIVPQSWKTVHSRDNVGHVLNNLSDDCINPSHCLSGTDQFGLIRESGRIRSLRLQSLQMKEKRAAHSGSAVRHQAG